jgi:hypothetical protein
LQVAGSAGYSFLGDENVSRVDAATLFQVLSNDSLRRSGAGVRLHDS